MRSFHRWSSFDRPNLHADSAFGPGAIVIRAQTIYLAKQLIGAFRWNQPWLRQAPASRRNIGCLRQRFFRDGGVNEDEMRRRLEVLRIEHRDLDAAINALSSTVMTDQLQIARLKKRKLRLKDQIAQIGDYLIPDIIA